MKNEYKNIYIVLSVFIVLYLATFTVGNVFIYGSVLQVNIAVLPLLLVIPLYVGFKQKLFLKRMAIMMAGYFLVILLVTLFILPEYTFNEARTKVTEETGSNWELQLKRNSDASNFIYKGQYLIETNQGQYIFNFKDGTYQLIQEVEE